MGNFPDVPENEWSGLCGSTKAVAQGIFAASYLCTPTQPFISIPEFEFRSRNS
jgi:hypothetical protein